MITWETTLNISFVVYLVGFALVLLAGLIDDIKNPGKYKKPEPFLSLLVASIWPFIALLVGYLVRRAKWSKGKA